MIDSNVLVKAIDEFISGTFDDDGEFFYNLYDIIKSDNYDIAEVKSLLKQKGLIPISCMNNPFNLSNISDAECFMTDGNIKEKMTVVYNFMNNFDIGVSDDEWEGEFFFTSSDSLDFHRNGRNNGIKSVYLNVEDGECDKLNDLVIDNIKLKAQRPLLADYSCVDKCEYEDTKFGRIYYLSEDLLVPIEIWENDREFSVRGKEYNYGGLWRKWMRIMCDYLGKVEDIDYIPDEIEKRLDYIKNVLEECGDDMQSVIGSVMYNLGYLDYFQDVDYMDGGSYITDPDDYDTDGEFSSMIYEY